MKDMVPIKVVFALFCTALAYKWTKTKYHGNHNGYISKMLHLRFSWQRQQLVIC